MARWYFLIFLILVSCNREKKIVQLMQVLEERINTEQGEYAERIEYRGDCNCYLKSGYIGESLKNQSYVFKLKNVDELVVYAGGGLSIWMLRPDSIEANMFEEEYDSIEHQEMLAWRKERGHINMLNNTDTIQQQLVYEHLKEVLTLCGANFRVYTYRNGEKVEIDK